MTIVRSKRITPYLISLPAFVFLAFALYSPILVLLRYSFAVKPSYGERMSFVWSLVNYQDFFFDPELEVFRMTLLKTLGVALLVTTICLIVGYPFAYFLASPRKTLRFKTLLTLLCLFPYLTGYIVRIYAWRVILGSGGVINHALQSLGLIKEPLTFLLYGPFSVFIALVYLYLPAFTFPIYLSFEKLNVNWLEAAEDLGADRVRTFLRVILPLTSPGILVGALIVFPIITASYAETVMLGGGWLRIMFGNLIQNSFFVSNEYPLGSASSAILLLIVVTACILLIGSVRIERIFKVR